LKIPFTKMQGAGNDFVVLDCTRQPFTLDSSQLKKIADRHLGIGCDQVLVVEKPKSAGADFGYRIFNADGGEVEQCGNGGLIRPRLEPDGEVSVEMGVPSRPVVEKLSVGNRQVELTTLSIGNPHAVQIVSDVASAPVTTQGPTIETHPRFPNRVNAGYMQVLDRHTIALRVWERGAGETLSCGSGACAAVVAGIARNLLDTPVKVETRGGTLTIAWPGGDNAVFMKGPAVTVYEGTIELQSKEP
jgi:diaminopimelate epimerase